MCQTNPGPNVAEQRHPLCASLLLPTTVILILLRSTAALLLLRPTCRAPVSSLAQVPPSRPKPQTAPEAMWWACSACTYRNTGMAAAQCEICGAPRQTKARPVKAVTTTTINSGGCRLLVVTEFSFPAFHKNKMISQFPDLVALTNRSLFGRDCCFHPPNTSLSFWDYNRFTSRKKECGLVRLLP